MNSILVCVLAAICVWNPNHGHYPFKHSLPCYDNVILKKAFTVSFNVDTKLPNWVAEELTLDNLKRKVNRENCQFKPDPYLPPEVQACEDDYRGSKLSHGHLAMAGLHAQTHAEMQETFSYVNIVPQDAHVNHKEWLTIENLQIDLLKHSPKGSVLYVVSGPLWLEWPPRKGITDRYIGPSNIRVPTDLFKVLKLVDERGHSASVGFIVPNARQGSKEKDPAWFKVDIEVIEKCSGLNLIDMKSDCDLCHCDTHEARPPVTRTDSWRLAWRLKIARTIQEVRSVVRVAIKRKYFSKQNPSLILSAVQRAEELSDEEVLDALTPLDCKRSLPYRSALKDALSSLDE